MKLLLKLATFAALACSVLHPAAAEIPHIPRVLPPEGLEIPADVRELFEYRLAAIKQRMAPQRGNALLPDVEIFAKAVELALIHREFYSPKDFAKADWALDQANSRLASLEKGESPWTKSTGLVVRGYRSSIDGSAQPYGLVIPKDHEFSKPCPLYVWLHGRGDKNTDLHFLQERATKVGQIAPPGAMVVHPFGRQCVGFKHAGETDVIEAWAHAEHHYQTDPNRRVLIGFSMGGAGAWHLGAHFPWQWAAVSPGAGFAETARYQRLRPENYPPWYEQALWGHYDAPSNVCSLFNTEVIAYSGELDKQIQAARVMEQAYQAEGRTLTHLIGPGVEHKYEPKTLEELLGRLQTIAANGREARPAKVHWQSRTLCYNVAGWVVVNALEEHWKDSRVDAELHSAESIRIRSKNVTGLHLTLDQFAGEVVIDGQKLLIPGEPKRPVPGIYLRKHGQEWRYEPDYNPLRDAKVAKRIDVTGPIDDCFRRNRFVVVTPSGKSNNPAFQEWVEFELNHLRDRWLALMRADLPEIRDVEYDSQQLVDCNVVLWGDFDSNAALAKVAEQLPVKFQGGTWTFGGQSLDGNQFVPALICPKIGPANLPIRYFVLNSGLTFREGHDKTNSQQNPKLPDWAIIDITQPPDAFLPGRIHDAGFFDEEWKLKGEVKGP